MKFNWKVVSDKTEKWETEKKAKLKMEKWQ